MVCEFLHLSEGRGGQCELAELFVCVALGGWERIFVCGTQSLGVSSPKEGLPAARGWVSMHLGRGWGRGDLA